MVHESGEFEEYSFRPVGLNVLTGVRNSSKTTTLKAIDYVFGDRGGVIDALGSAVADEYVEISLVVALNGTIRRIRRNLRRPNIGKVFVDDIELSAAAFSGFIMNELGWPSINIPKGISALTASEVIPLTFRSVLRHIYRNEDSWTSFANQEHEYLRRAVISLLLGFARERYETNEFELNQARKRLTEAQAVQRDVNSSTDRAVEAISTQLGIPVVHDVGELSRAQNELGAELDRAYARRTQLASEIDSLIGNTSSANSDTPGYDRTLASQYEEASKLLRLAAEDVVNLEQLHAEYTSSHAMVTAELARMDRLIASVEAFDALPVRVCPACEQAVDPRRPHALDACYLCTQPVTEDLRQRRAELEKRTLSAEASELAEAIARTSRDLQVARDRESHLRREHERLAKLLNEERAILLAPFLGSLEDLASQIARLEQRLTTFPAIRQILSRKVEAASAVDTIADEIAILTRNAEKSPHSRISPVDRCALLADRMNEFLEPFRDRGWVDGAVTVSADDLTFFVGTRPWDQQLGAEARVLFFLAYSRALLFLDSDIGADCCHPGFLMLDNPFQQGIQATVIRDALINIHGVAETTGSQVISTQAVPLRPHEGINEIPMPNVYK
ncbi:hypothetical protein [Microbispora catharanthi]|uniref:Uncharacterized protein n=1 Tax=Microbispora catharanthi TaxID=1712871 RepID=A0A5N6BDX8_9ACTN|nr:hypothetical protein [Microbispora catharanthi]KAB8178338.1 hypothetical protein FH610_036850 [Microbispora catharanthi]